MNRHNLTCVAFLLLSTLLGIVLGSSENAESSYQDGRTFAMASSAASDLSTELTAYECQECRRRQASAGWDDRSVGASAAKINPEMAEQTTCAPVEEKVGQPLEPLSKMSSVIAAGSDKRVSVSALIDRALKDQVVFLEARAAELQRWSPADRARFALWFGTTDDEARVLIYRRLAVLAKLNEAYGVKNFRRGRHRPGIFAYVHPTDPSRIFVDLEFVKATRVGTNSRAGTITHEMSHFVVAGGTKDHAYGTEKCKQLARSNPVLALMNADNFEFYVEGAR
jgi:hypothetical protein